MKITSKFNLALGLAVILALYSCKKGPEEFQIQEGVKVQLTEQGDDFSIEARTENTFSCENYLIIYELKQDEDEIFIEFKHVEEAELCYTAIGPARITIELGELTLPSYEFTFSLNDSITKGTLTTSSAILSLGEGNVSLVD